MLFRDVIGTVGKAPSPGPLEHQRQAEHTPPEIDRSLPVGAHRSDVVHALGLEFGRHGTARYGESAIAAWNSNAASAGRLASCWSAAALQD
jgi:hypothetical protein